MEEEEFQEADILWPGSGEQQDIVSINNKVITDSTTDATSISKLIISSPEPPSSAPVEISRRKRRCRPWAPEEHDMFDETTAVIDDDDDEEAVCPADNKANTATTTTVVPPHVIVARRRLRLGGSRTAAYSMCAGKGRTLKGRDLRDVRNRVLRMTGFIEK